MFTVWVIGYFFTVGLVDEPKKTWYADAGTMALYLLIWPMILGNFIKKQLNGGGY
jgi:hypothetical protein